MRSTPLHGEALVDGEALGGAPSPRRRGATRATRRTGRDPSDRTAGSHVVFGLRRLTLEGSRER